MAIANKTSKSAWGGGGGGKCNEAGRGINGEETEQIAT